MPSLISHESFIYNFPSTPNVKNPSTQTGRRSVSTRQSSRSTVPGRVSSVIIHDTDDEEDQGDDEQREDAEETENQPQTQPDLVPPPRTRKVKETQTRLGVGRPVAAGGSGARAVTKSQSVSRGKRVKASKSMKLTEATIPEEGAPGFWLFCTFLFIALFPDPEAEESPAPSGKSSPIRF